MLRRIALCMTLLTGFAHAARSTTALRQYDSGKYGELRKRSSRSRKTATRARRKKLR